MLFKSQPNNAPTKGIAKKLKCMFISLIKNPKGWFNPQGLIDFLGRTMGLEPTAYSATNCRSNLLSYALRLLLPINSGRKNKVNHICGQLKFE